MRISDKIVHGIATAIDVGVDVIERLTDKLHRPEPAKASKARTPDDEDYLSTRLRDLKAKTELARLRLQAAGARRRALEKRYLDVMDIDQVTREKLEQLAAEDAVALLGLFDATNPEDLARFLGQETVANVRSQLIRLVGTESQPPRNTKAFGLGARTESPPPAVADRRNAIMERITELRKQLISSDVFRELESLERELDQTE